MMAEFLHEITKKREEEARINTLINNEDVRLSMEMREWERCLIASFVPPAGEEPF
jgi:hypothetical protein